MTIISARSLLVLMLVLAVPGLVLAHGESAPGPNGGAIRMPGAFHVEVVAGNNALLVYLLDMQFENPKIVDSSVTAELRQNGGKWQLECRAEEGEERFRCPLPSGAGLDTGTLMVIASRGAVPEAAARYELPLLGRHGTG